MLSARKRKRPAYGPFFFSRYMYQKKRTYQNNIRSLKRRTRRSSINGIGRPRPKRPLLRAILCGAIIWAILPFGLMSLRNSGIMDSKDMPVYPVNQIQSSQNHDNEDYIKNLPADWANFTGHMEMRLWDHHSGSLIHMDLEEYVVGVVAAEMPASFGLEALKAQAVAARTYALLRMTQGASAQVIAIHPQAQLTSDHNINQAWIDQKEREKRWGVNFPGNEAKIRQAVGETQGIILLYKGAMIDPLYHASCGGEKTEDIENVWGKSLPYLQSVRCSGHKDKHENVEAVFSLSEVDEALGTSLNALPASVFTSKDQGSACQVVETTDAGRVVNLAVTGKYFTGAEVRSKLNLPSAMFDVKLAEDQFKVISCGYGHGVGMCQYGAADYAAKGDHYQKILLHYYKGAQLAKVAES